MRWRGRRIARLVVALAAAACVLLGPTQLAADAAQSDDGSTGAITGYVVDATGNIVTGARVTLLDQPDQVAITGDDGAYLFEGIVTGDHLLQAQSPDAMSDALVVSVPADDFGVLDLLLSNALPVAAEQPLTPDNPPPAPDNPPPPPDNQGQPTETQAAPTDTPTPAQPTPTPEVPTATATGVPPTSTATATVIEMALLSGSVKDDLGAAPPAGTRIVMFDLPVLQVTVEGDGSYSLAGIPPGTHYVYATSPQKSPSDVQAITFGGNQVRNFNLGPFAGGGNPTVFSGEVVNPNKNAVQGATVWRLGAASRTSSGNNGGFTLVDATRQSPGSSSGLGKAPDKVVLMAVKDDQWGFLDLDSNKTPSPMAIVLNQHGNPPGPPKTFNWKGNFSSNQGEFFIARWRSGQHKDLGIRLVLGDKSTVDPGGNSFGQCVGDCSNFTGDAFVVALPPGQSFSIEAWNNALGTDGAVEPNPDWDEAQVVSH